MNDRYNDANTPARLYAGGVGATLLLVGVLGFFYSSAFGTPGEVDGLLGIFDVNGWHNIVHLASGLLGLAAYSAGARASRTYALAFGAVYIVVAIWGFAVGDGTILEVLPVNGADNVLHALLGITGVGAGLASPDRRRTVDTTARA